MKNSCKHNRQQLQTQILSTSQSHLPLLLGKFNFNTNFLTKNHIDDLQADLKHLYGFKITQKTIPHLTIYCQYYRMLKQILTTVRANNKSNKSSFLSEFSRSHSEQRVSKLLQAIEHKGNMLKSNSVDYGRQCMINYFGIHEFSQDKLVIFLTSKINAAKNSGIISFDQYCSQRNTRVFQAFHQKQNKNKIPYPEQNCLPNRNILSQKQSKVYYQILALKVILKQHNPDFNETNRLCQSIKIDLENLLATLKIKKASRDNQMKKKSTFRQQ